MSKTHPLVIEAEVRAKYNEVNGTNASKQRLILPGGHAQHEFDLVDRGILIGGISTSPWRTGSGRNWNTGGQDRAASELFWLSLLDGPGRRIHILTDEEMAQKLFSRYGQIPMRAPIDIHHYSVLRSEFSLVGTLGV